MIGTPKYLNTKKDYEYTKANFPEEIWRPRFEALLQDVKQWFNTGALAEGVSGIEDETHKIVEDAGVAGSPATRYQFELRDDPNCALFRLGYTVAEVEQILVRG